MSITHLNPPEMHKVPAFFRARRARRFANPLRRRPERRRCRWEGRRPHDRGADRAGIAQRLAVLRRGRRRAAGRRQDEHPHHRGDRPERRVRSFARGLGTNPPRSPSSACPPSRTRTSSSKSTPSRPFPTDGARTAPALSENGARGRRIFRSFCSSASVSPSSSLPGPSGIPVVIAAAVLDSSRRSAPALVATRAGAKVGPRR